MRALVIGFYFSAQPRVSVTGDNSDMHRPIQQWRSQFGPGLCHQSTKAQIQHCGFEDLEKRCHSMDQLSGIDSRLIGEEDHR